MREPRTNPIFLFLVVICVLTSTPFFFYLCPTTATLWGIPVWLLVTLVASFGLAAVTAWGMLCLWNDDDHD